MSIKEINANLELIRKNLMLVFSADTKVPGKPEAQRMLNEFKEKSPIVVPCALKLVEKSQTSFFRLFGLQLLQHTVKLRWGEMQLNDQKILKRNVMSLITNGTKHITLEKSDVKEGFARVAVELIKQDWPHQWPKLLVELDGISKKQDINADLVLLILWRLAEDVVTLQIEPVPRGPELKHSLVENMKEILAIIQFLLEKNVSRYRLVKHDASQQSQACCTVAVTAIYTLAGYISWMGIWHLTQDNCKLLDTLWLLLDEPELQLPSAECILVALKRLEKYKSNGGPLIALFGDTAINALISAAKTTPGEEMTEKHKNFLKKLCQVVCNLGTVLCNMMVSATPSNFGRYLNSLLDFTERSTQFLHFSTQNTWSSLFKHEVLSHDPKLLAILPNYLSATLTNLEKVGFHSKNEISSGKTVSLGLVTDKDFSATYTTIHDQQKEIIKLACKVDPVVCFEMASWCLKCQLSPTVKPGPMKTGVTPKLRSISATSLEQWEAMSFFFEIVISTILELLDKRKIPLKDGLDLMKLIVTFETKDPAILSCVHSNISTLLPFFNSINECKPEIISVLFEIVEAVKDPKVKVLREIRNLAFASIIKLCRDHTVLLVTHFEMLFNHVKQMLANELLLSGLEKSWLTRCLVLISNQFKSYERQKAFLEELLTPVASLWLSEVMQWLLSDPETFIPYVGADMQMAGTEMESPTALYRSRISYCVSSILEVLRWTRVPPKPEEAETGGFVVSRMPNGAPVYRNPCTELILTLLNNVFALIRIQHILYMPEVINTVGDSLAQVLKRLEVDKGFEPDPQQPLLEIFNPPFYETELEKMQEFFSSLYEDCFSILGLAAQSLTQHLYRVDDLVGQLLNSAFINLEYIPTYRLHTMLLTFVKPLSLSCPPEYYDPLLCPVIAPLLVAIHKRLTSEWQLLEQQQNRHEETPTSEVDKEQVKLLTQEVIRFIDSCCVTTKSSDPSDAAKCDGGADKNVASEVESPQAALLTLTDLGVCFMKETDIRAALLITAFTSLVWKDSLTCYRSATHLCWPLLRQVISEPLLPDAVTYFFSMVLKALEQHTDHTVYIDALVQLAFQIYEALRPRYAELREEIQKVKDIKDYFLVTYDKKVTSTPLTSQEYTLRKYFFTRLLQSYIGKPPSEKNSEEANAEYPPPAAKKMKPLMSFSTDPQHVSAPSGNLEHLPPVEHPYGNPQQLPAQFPVQHVVPRFAQPNIYEHPFRNPEPHGPNFLEINRFGVPLNNQMYLRDQMPFQPFFRNPQFFQARFR